jgi:hypothetical protein
MGWRYKKISEYRIGVGGSRKAKSPALSALFGTKHHEIIVSEESGFAL